MEVPLGLGRLGSAVMVAPSKSSIVTVTVQVPSATLTVAVPGGADGDRANTVAGRVGALDQDRVHAVLAAAAGGRLAAQKSQLTCSVPSLLQPPVASAASSDRARAQRGIMRGLYHQPAAGRETRSTSVGGVTTSAAGVCVSVSPQLLIENLVVWAGASALPWLS